MMCVSYLSENYHAMKGQDIVLLLYLQQLHLQVADAACYGNRQIEAMLGISKTEVSRAMKRCSKANLMIQSLSTGLPKPNANALLEFLVHGVSYVFPVEPSKLVRGIPTAFSAPAYADKLLSAGDMPMVWEHEDSDIMGQSIEPLYTSIPTAIAVQPEQLAHVYASLALVDAIRIGAPREKAVASDLLKQHLKNNLSEPA